MISLQDQTIIETRYHKLHSPSTYLNVINLEICDDCKSELARVKVCVKCFKSLVRLAVKTLDEERTNKK